MQERFRLFVGSLGDLRLGVDAFVGSVSERCQACIAIELSRCLEMGEGNGDDHHVDGNSVSQAFDCLEQLRLMADLLVGLHQLFNLLVNDGNLPVKSLKHSRPRALLALVVPCIHVALLVVKLHLISGGDKNWVFLICNNY